MFHSWRIINLFIYYRLKRKWRDSHVCRHSRDDWACNGSLIQEVPFKNGMMEQEFRIWKDQGKNKTEAYALGRRYRCMCLKDTIFLIYSVFFVFLPFPVVTLRSQPSNQLPGPVFHGPTRHETAQINRRNTSNFSLPSVLTLRFLWRRTQEAP